MSRRSPAISLVDWGAVSLVELNKRAALLDREETKYLVTATNIRAVLDGLADRFDVLTIEGRTLFRYETIYYDTDDLLTYRQHAQGKRRRMKVRSRRYLDDGGCFFEVKLKGSRGRTIKERFAYDEDRHGSVDEAAARHLRDCVNRVYSERFEQPLSPQLTMRFRRLTLVGRGRPERVTADFDLQFIGPNGTTVSPSHDPVIIEVKSEHGYGTADRVLRGAGVRPTSCSKYCIGLNLVYADLRYYNNFKRTLTEHFGWQPADTSDVDQG